MERVKGKERKRVRMRHGEKDAKIDRKIVRERDIYTYIMREGG